MTATTEPRELVRGDSTTWTKTLPDYPAPTWTLTYSFRSGDELITKAATASGTDHLVALLTGDTDSFIAGTWDWQAHADNGTDRVTVDRGQIEIRPDLSDSKADARSQYQRILDAIEEVIEGKAEHDLSQFGIRSRSGSKLSWEELLSVQRYYQGKVLEEQGKKPAFINTRFG